LRVGAASSPDLLGDEHDPDAVKRIAA